MIVPNDGGRTKKMPQHASQTKASVAPSVARCAALLLVAATTSSMQAFGQSREALGDGDNVRITVFQNPDLTTETRISERGTITFPLIGEVAVAGLTPAAAE